jgi:D-3-phosphoglycerate dehydrogenase
MARIAILDRGYASYDYEKDRFAAHGHELDIYPGDQGDLDAKISFSQDAEGILVRGTLLDERFFNKASRLRAVVRYGVGYDNVDLEAATRRGIRVANVQGYATQSVSDHALALIYACIRGLPAGQDKVISSFLKPPSTELFELHNKTLGIIGLGRIGSALSRKCEPLFKRILAVDPYIPDGDFTISGAIKSDLDTLFRDCHVISLHCNLTDETRHMVDRRAFRKMELRPVIINTARGEVMDQPALLNALAEDIVHSAGIDVYEHEPPGQHETALFSHPRIIATGHYAWYSETSMTELQKRATENMIALLKGEEIEDCLNP